MVCPQPVSVKPTTSITIISDLLNIPTLHM
jgi:hypothetical protein